MRSQLWPEATIANGVSRTTPHATPLLRDTRTRLAFLHCGCLTKSFVNLAYACGGEHVHNHAKG